ncbi:MAG: TolC family protein [Elusimicrobia bacterium]|nr:TolC family protein [Elusimicrobiota bacterium]
MKRIIVLASTILATFLIPMGAACQESNTAVPERVLSISLSISLALNNRKEALLADKEIKIAVERINEAESFNYPKIDMTFNYSRVDTDHWMMLPPTFGSLLIPRTTPGDYCLTRLSLWQHVYSGGVYKSNSKLAQSNLERADSQKKVVQNDITFEVKKEFYSLLATEKKLETYKTVISSIEQKMESVPAPSSWTSVEKLQVQDGLQGLKNEYTLLKNEYEKQKLEFLQTIGLELNTSFEINETFEPIMEIYDLNKLLAWAFQYRPEPKQVQVQEEMDALSVKLSMAARSPTVSLGAHYEFPGETFNFDKKAWNATVNLSLPIYDGFASIYRTRQKNLQKDQNKLKRKDMEDSIQFEVRKSYMDYNFWMNEMSERKNQLNNSEQLLPAGIIGNSPTMVAVYNSYVKYKLSYIEATKEHLISRVTVEHAIGKTLAKE